MLYEFLKTLNDILNVIIYLNKVAMKKYISIYKMYYKCKGESKEILGFFINFIKLNLVQEKFV